MEPTGATYHSSVRRIPVIASALLSGTLALTLTAPSTASASAATPSPDDIAVAADTSTSEVTRDQAEETLAEVQNLMEASPTSRATDLDRAQAHAHGRSATLALRDLWVARSHLGRADRRTANRLLARPTDVPGDQLTNDYTASIRGDAKQCNANFCVEYDTSGQNAADPVKFVPSVLEAMSFVRNRFVNELGYRAPRSDGDWAGQKGNPDGRFDIQLADIGRKGFYGYCQRDAQRTSAYCVLDNDFASSQFRGTSPLKSLRVTAAHEFFHAIQFEYDVNDDLWFMEGSAVWAEERAYDSANDYLQYIRSDSAITNSSIPVDQNSYGNLRVYSSMLMFEHLTQTLGVARMREAWQRAEGPAYSLQALRAVVSERTSWPKFISRFAVWNSRPPGVGYAERASYPKGRMAVVKTLGWRGTRSFSPVVRKRSHLASAAYQIKVSRRSTVRQRLRIAIDGPNPARGAVAAVQRRLKSGTVRWSHVRLNRKGDAVVVVPFGRGKVSSVVVTVANSNTRMNNCGGYYRYTSYSCGGYGAFNARFAVSAKVLR